MGHPLYPAKLAITSVPADGLVTETSFQLAIMFSIIAAMLLSAKA